MVSGSTQAYGKSGQEAKIGTDSVSFPGDCLPFAFSSRTANGKPENAPDNLAAANHRPMMYAEWCTEMDFSRANFDRIGRSEKKHPPR